MLYRCELMLNKLAFRQYPILCGVFLFPIFSRLIWVSIIYISCIILVFSRTSAILSERIRVEEVLAGPVAGRALF